MRGTRILAVAIVLAGASLAWGQSGLWVLAPYGTETSSEGNSITPDGQWIVGNSGGGENRGVLWKASDPATAINVLGGSIQAGYLRGIAYRTEPTHGQELVMFGKTNGTTGPTYWFYRPGDQTWGAKLRWTSEVNSLPASNAVAPYAAQADAVFTTWGRGSQNQIKVEKVWGQSDTAPISTIQDQKSTTAESGTQAISQTGRAVGWRKQDLGAGLVACNYVADFSDDGIAGNLACTYYNGLKGTSEGQGEAISADGTIACGYSPVSDGRTGNWPYKAVLAADRSLTSIVELPSLNTAATANQGIVYGMTADGAWGVGRDYSNNMDQAVLWDLQNPTFPPTDLTALATQLGILGSFDAVNGLRRAYSVGADSLYLYITGMGNTAAGPRGFFLKIPKGTNLGACCVKHLGYRTCEITTDDNCPNEASPETTTWTANASCASVCPYCGIPWADADFDGDVDQDDLGILQACFSGTAALATGCECFDRAGTTGVIDASEFAKFEKCAIGNGPAIAFADHSTIDAPCDPGDGSLP